jgi:hypothetical protein
LDDAQANLAAVLAMIDAVGSGAAVEVRSE